MARGTRLSFVVVSIALLVVATVLPAAAQREADPNVEQGPQTWIVRLQPDASVEAVTSEQVQSRGGVVTQQYSQAINGFAAEMSDDVVESLRADARVLAVMPDFEVHGSAQSIPNGVKRINATANDTAAINGVDTRVDVDVAVLDSGVTAHSDLYIAGGKDCTGAGSWADGNGHGTHVAGTIGALDNGIGVVGVAPGARIWSVRVLNSQGNGYGSWILCGLDWVTANAATIEVANMSLGGATSYVDDNNCGLSNHDILHQAVCESTQAGVTYVVAAGNDADDAANYFPASYNEVITVSALADSDGKSGGQGSATWAGADDTFASFSNYGPDVDVIAPGVDILSTYRTGGYATMSGTSMASPHVAGAAALYIAVNPSASPSAVRSALIASGNTSTWSGDKDSAKEPLIDAGNLDGDTTPPPPPPPPSTVDAQAVSVSVPASVAKGATATVNVSVRNNGSASASIAVALAESPGGFAQTKSITLNAGATGTVSFSWATNASTTTGTHTFTATVSLAGDSNAGNNSTTATTNVTAGSTATSMSVSSLTLTSTKYGVYHRLTSQVQIKAGGVAVSSATVMVQITYPNGAKYTLSAKTSSAGVASFTRNVTLKGQYTVTVTNVVKAGSTYDASGNTITSKSLTVQ